MLGVTRNLTSLGTKVADLHRWMKEAFGAPGKDPADEANPARAQDA